MDTVINPPIMSSKEASAYLNLEPKHDPMRVARSRGNLWGVTAPKFIKIGSKIVYKKHHLDEWLNSFQSYTNNAQCLNELGSV